MNPVRPQVGKQAYTDVVVYAGCQKNNGNFGEV
jgi:hypothetical protein